MIPSFLLCFSGCFIDQDGYDWNVTLKLPYLLKQRVQNHLWISSSKPNHFAFESCPIWSLVRFHIKRGLFTDSYLCCQHLVLTPPAIQNIAKSNAQNRNYRQTVDKSVQCVDDRVVSHLLCKQAWDKALVHSAHQMWPHICLFLAP